MRPAYKLYKSSLICGELNFQSLSVKLIKFPALSTLIILEMRRRYSIVKLYIWNDV